MQQVYLNSAALNQTIVKRDKLLLLEYNDCTFVLEHMRNILLLSYNLIRLF